MAQRKIASACRVTALLANQLAEKAEGACSPNLSVEGGAGTARRIAYVFIHGDISSVGVYPPLLPVGIRAIPPMRCVIFVSKDIKLRGRMRCPPSPRMRENWGEYMLVNQRHNPGLLQEKEHFVRYMATTSAKEPASRETV